MALHAIYSVLFKGSWEFALMEAYTGIPTIGSAIISYLCAVYWRKRVRQQNVTTVFVAMSQIGEVLSFLSVVLFVGLFVWIRLLK